MATHEQLTLLGFSHMQQTETMARAVGTTKFQTVAIDIGTGNPSSPLKSKSSFLEKPNSKKRKLNDGSVVDLTTSENEVENEVEGLEEPKNSYFTIWRHRLHFEVQEKNISLVQQKLQDMGLTRGGKVAAKVKIEHKHHLPLDAEGGHTVRDSMHVFIEDIDVHEARGGFINAAIHGGTDGPGFASFFKKLRASKKLQSSFTIAWSYIPTVCSLDEPYIALEFDLRKQDTAVIDWKAEKWLSAFLSFVLDDKEKPVDSAKLQSVIATKAATKGDIKPKDFYDAVFVPDASKPVPQMIQVNELTTQMFPFQMRTVNWMMEREGVTVENDNVEFLPPNNLIESLGFEKTVDYDGKEMYVSVPLGVTTSNLEELRKTAASFQVKGGILAEEMGLGKTVELISLVALHKRFIPEGQETIWDSYSAANVRAAGSTLIICPPSIMQQWVNELELHAPDLKVLKYNGTRDLLQLVYQKKNGIKGRISNDRYVELSFEMQGIPNAELVDHILGYDIVISSYNVLANELHYAERPPDRRLRYEKKYERRSCPLVEISWWRVCLDEAQMIENGVSNAAQVARLIPRVNAWAVTGTPVQKSIEDLFGLLVFLRQNPWCGNKSTWEKLCFKKEWFAEVFGQLALRHTKDIVHEEIKLPRQHRTAVSLAFSQIEEENYQRLFEQACNDIGVQFDGSPLRGDWNPNNDEIRARMRSWLVRLRQTCVHPQVGAQNRRALGASGPLRTVDEVLDIMVQQNTTSIKQDQRMMFLLIAANAQIVSAALDKPEDTVKMLEKHIGDLEAAVTECRKEVEDEEKRRAALKASLNEKDTDMDLDIASKSAKTAETADDDYIEDKPAKEDWEESDDENDDEETSGSASELNKLKNRLRDILEVEHVFQMFLGDAYFNVKDRIPEDDEDRKAERAELETKEIAHYEAAKLLRKEIMAESEKQVNKMIGKIDKRVEQQDFVDIPELDIKDQKGGIESSSIMEDIQMLAEKLNEQADVLDEWRENLIQLLRAPLIDDSTNDAELEGDELQQSAENQDEGFLYVALLRTVVGDRAEAISGETSLLAVSEIRTAASASLNYDEKHQTLFQDLKARRDDVKPINVDADIDAGTSARQYSLKGLLAKLRIIANAHRDPNASARTKAESGLVAQALKKLQLIYTDQEKALDNLKKEIQFLGDTFNARAAFYRQLQVVSDMVEGFKPEKALKANHVQDVESLQAKYTTEIKQLSDRVGRYKSKGRFLQHLQETQGESQRLCIICRDNIERGVLTVCGHQFCTECMSAWNKHHSSCPMCKRMLRKVDLHPVTYRIEEITIEREKAQASKSQHLVPDGSSTVSEELQIYSGIDDDTFKKIQKIKLATSFGSKIDMVVKHLLWIRRYGGGKSVIFSQWKEVLDVFQKALDGNGIQFSSLEEKKGLNIFKTDLKCEVFLLHAKSQSAGLTLVAASNVFLCEPLVNTGLELQAIARVHRIGQKRETNVFLYVIGNTVEESVWKHATKRRLEMMEKTDEASPKKKRKLSEEDNNGKKRMMEKDIEMQLETANSLQLQEGTVSSMVERGQGGGEVVDNEQLWSCLFEVKRRDRNAELAETRREIMASAREEGRGNVVDDSGGS